MARFAGKERELSSNPLVDFTHDTAVRLNYEGYKLIWSRGLGKDYYAQELRGLIGFGVDPRDLESANSLIALPPEGLILPSSNRISLVEQKDALANYSAAIQNKLGTDDIEARLLPVGLMVDLLVHNYLSGRGYLFSKRPQQYPTVGRVKREPLTNLYLATSSLIGDNRAVILRAHTNRDGLEITFRQRLIDQGYENVWAPILVVPKEQKPITGHTGFETYRSRIRLTRDLASLSTPELEYRLSPQDLRKTAISLLVAAGIIAGAVAVDHFFPQSPQSTQQVEINRAFATLLLGLEANGDLSDVLTRQKHLLKSVEFFHNYSGIDMNSYELMKTAEEVSKEQLPFKLTRLITWESLYTQAALSQIRHPDVKYSLYGGLAVIESTQGFTFNVKDLEKGKVSVQGLGANSAMAWFAAARLDQLLTGNYATFEPREIEYHPANNKLWELFSLLPEAEPVFMDAFLHSDPQKAGEFLLSKTNYTFKDQAEKDRFIYDLFIGMDGGLSKFDEIIRYLKQQKGLK